MPANHLRDAVYHAILLCLDDLFNQLPQADTAAHAHTHELLQLISKEQEKMAIDLTRLTADVAGTQGFRASVIVMIKGLQDQVKTLQDAAAAGNTDPAVQAEIDNLATQLEAAAAPLADATVANPAPTDPAPVEGNPVPDAPTLGVAS